ncbi:putative tetratricopeptide-like helical domain superfamily [Helianthus annuus]|uniref:Tetratricopeptide-like helical domain superfamily n=1 Tax=Helianthus annuus TaxID=4232 RepID=A0A9K3JN36_HELAN|nr:putative tetratricopeptide-like helical domain superfamily [Helianthus annuus]
MRRLLQLVLDLRCGAKKSLADPPRQSLVLKSCDISSTRPHLLLVGGSDSFARLYDRRMLSPLSSGRNKQPPPPCVNYFCPMHLSDHGRQGLHLTHVTFSPNGEEILLNYSGEHVYLMDVNPVQGSSMRYTSDDAMKFFNPTTILKEVQSKPPHSDFPNRVLAKRNLTASLDQCRKLLQIAEKSLKEGANYYYGIEACNDVLHGHGQIGHTLILECLCLRAALFLKRDWKNDVHMAIRDCLRAVEIDPASFRALHCMSEALLQANSKF